jgi:outer membrane protein TolC
MPRPSIPPALLALALLSSAAAVPAAGEPAPALDALVAEALAASPALAAARAELAARVAEQRAAGSLPDPMVEAMLQNAGFEWTVGDEDMSMLGVAVRQELPHPAKRQAARGVAAARTAAAVVELEHVRRQLVHDVRERYAAIYALDRERETLAAARELVDLLEATARGRYAAGESEASALLRAQLERTRVDERVADLLAERAAVVAQLDRWLGRPGDTPLGTVVDLPVPAFAAPLDAAVVDHATEVARTAAAVAVAEAEVAAREAELEVDLAPTAGVGWRGDEDPVLTLGVGVTLPLWKRKKQLPLLEAARQDVLAGRARLADARVAALAEAATYATAWHNADDQLRRYRDGVVPQSEAAFDAARSSYLGGRTGFAEVLEAFATWLDARAAVARREADRFTAWAGLAHLLEAHAEIPDSPASDGGALPRSGDLP